MHRRHSHGRGSAAPVASAIATAALLVGLVVAPPTAAGADVLTVTRFDDPSPDTCAATDCSLREAVIAANGDPDADSIRLPPGTYSLSIPGIREDSSATGDLDLLAPVTIEGSGADRTTIRGAGSGDRIIHVLHFASGPITLSGVTIRDGTTRWVDTQSDSGAGIAMYPSKNGVRAFEELILRGVHITGNESGRDGGGLWSAAVLTIVDSTISGNRAFGDGGGAWISSTANLTNVTVSGNTASGSGGGVASLGSFTDGAPNDVRILNSTITDNSADLGFSPGGDGGGILSIPTTTLRNTIVAGNSDRKSDGPTYYPDCAGEFIADGYNLVGIDAGCEGLGGTDQFGTPAAPLSPKLSLLGKGPPGKPKPGTIDYLNGHGGPTPTHALLGGSPAIDRGSPSAPGSSETSCSAGDQRGMPRPQGGACDVGAYELGLCLGVPVNRIGTPGPDNMQGSSILHESFLLFSGTDTVNGGSGDDMICGGDGDDVLTGGPGKDRLDGGPGVDTVDFSHMTAYTGPLVDLSKGTAEGIGIGTDQLVAIENVVGSSGKDTLRGSAGPNMLNGLGGKDELFGVQGDDLLLGGPGPDRLVGGPGHDRLLGEAGVDHLLGGTGADRLVGGPRRDRLEGQGGPDHLLGGPGADELRGGRGFDSCVGGRGRDVKIGCETAFTFLK
jgi:CSLREA domain-containing protein